MESQPIRVMVVDDSAVMRQVISDWISASPDMEVAARVGDGRRAIELCRTLRPDVVTLDIQMPGMDGLATLESLLDVQPVPVIMVSSLTRAGAKITLDALERGAIDYLAKPDRGSRAAETAREELLGKIRSVAGTDIGRILRIRAQCKARRAVQDRPRPATEDVSLLGSRELADKCIAIGISTGGPPALAALFEALRPPMPPILVVQHMPPLFTKPLSWRLDSLSKLSVKEAAEGDVLRPNHVLIAPGGKHVEVRRHGQWIKTVIADGPPVSGHKPSVDVMMSSVAKLFGAGCLGIIMTGMGRDGVAGCAAIRAAGGYVLGQDEATSDVYGMNKVAHQEGHVDLQFSLDAAASLVTQTVQRQWRPATASAH